VFGTLFVSNCTTYSNDPDSPLRKQDNPCHPKRVVHHPSVRLCNGRLYCTP
jgi:hypothetical protein